MHTAPKRAQVTLITISALLIAGGLATMFTALGTIPTTVDPLEQALTIAFGTAGETEAAILARHAAEHRFNAAGGALLAAVGAVAGLLALAVRSLAPAPAHADQAAPEAAPAATTPAAPAAPPLSRVIQ